MMSAGCLRDPRRPAGVAAILTAVLLAGCELLDPAPGGNGGPIGVPPNTTVSLDIGRRLFAENCARCHGDSAQGTTVARSLQGLSGIETIVRSGKGSMPPFPYLSPADIRSIDLYISEFSGGLDTLSGAPLFGAACSRCHGPNAEGVVGEGPGLQGIADIAGVVRSGRGGMPAFPRLTDAQIASLEAFFAGVPFERTGRNLYVRHCMTCHGPYARGTRQGPDIHDKEAHDLEEAVREGKEGMPAFPELSREDVRLIGDYIQSL